MSRLRDVSIRRKLSLGMMAVSGLGLIVACAAFVTLDHIGRRRSLVDHVTSIADISAHNSAGAVEFHDEATARQILFALRSQEQIIAARLFDGEGSPLADYARNNQRLIGHILRREGSTVEFADDGQIAIEKAQRASGSDRAFDVILMDMQMPRIDGYTATEILRSEGF